MGLTSIGNWVNLLIVSADFPSTGVILIQILTGFVGSLIASAFIAWISERRFNRAIEASEHNVANALEPINSTVSSMAQSVTRLGEAMQAVPVIGNEIKTLAVVVDRIREGLEKTK